MIRVNGQPLDWTPGMTVADALAKMDYTAITLITVFVNEVHVATEDHEVTPLPDGADMKAMHLHHGG